MTQSKFFKAFAILNALAFVALFLLYRNGSFDSYFYTNKNTTLTSPNGGTPTKPASQIPKTLTSPEEIERLSSSKTVIMTDYIKIKKDSPTKKTDSLKVKLKPNTRDLMYSSKSGIIFENRKQKKDSITQVQQKKKARK